MQLVQVAAGEGEVNHVIYWPRPDPAGGEVPDRVVGSHITRSSERESQLSYGATASILA
jgi:hypothetical protein